MAKVRVPETYRFRLMVYELRVGRSRWYGAALAAAIAYIAARQVNDPIALTIITAAIILAGTCLVMQLLVYENAALQLRWLIDAKWVSPDDPLAESRRAHPVWGVHFPVFDVADYRPNRHSDSCGPCVRHVPEFWYVRLQPICELAHCLLFRRSVREWHHSIHHRTNSR